jgi:hypothetical protein
VLQPGIVALAEQQEVFYLNNRVQNTDSSTGVIKAILLGQRTPCIIDEKHMNILGCVRQEKENPVQLVCYLQSVLINSSIYAAHYH